MCKWHAIAIVINNWVILLGIFVRYKHVYVVSRELRRAAAIDPLDEAVSGWNDQDS